MLMMTLAICPCMAFFSGMCHSPVRGLHRPAARCLIIDDDSSPRVELLPYLHDCGVERDGRFAVVGTLTGHERFDDATQGFGTEQVVGNDHRPVRLGRLPAFGRLLGLLRRLLFFRRHGWFFLVFLPTGSFFGHGGHSNAVRGIFRIHDGRPWAPAPVRLWEPRPWAVVPHTTRAALTARSGACCAWTIGTGPRRGGRSSDASLRVERC